MQLSSVQVTKAFISRIQDVNGLLNCCVDNRFEEALKEALEADELIKSGKYTVEELEEKFPFLGVPISTKDCIAVKGEFAAACHYSFAKFKVSKFCIFF